MPADDVNKHRAIINIFVHSIYLYDDHFTLIINASKKPLSIDNIPLDDIETALEGETGALEGCSSLNTPPPPSRGYKKDIARENPDFIGVFTVLYGKISATDFVDVNRSFSLYVMPTEQWCIFSSARK